MTLTDASVTDPAAPTAEAPTIYDRLLSLAADGDAPAGYRQLAVDAIAAAAEEHRGLINIWSQAACVAKLAKTIRPVNRTDLSRLLPHGLLDELDELAGLV